MSHETRTSDRSPLAVLAVCVLSAVLGAGVYAASAAAADGSASGGADQPGHVVLRGGASTDASVVSLSGESVSDGELMIHAAYEAAQRMVELQTTGTTTAPSPTVTAIP